MKKLLSLRIPTYLGLLILFLGLGITIFLVGGRTIVSSNASGDDQPQNIRITNVTDTSFTISYFTQVPVLGTISVGTDPKKSTITLDDRDQTKGGPAAHLAHYFTLAHLTPKTTYYFSIVSGKSTFLENNQPFHVTTGATLTTNPPFLPQFYGSIVMPDTPSEVIVYALSDGTQPVSTLLRPDASYVLSLLGIRSSNLSTYRSLPPGSRVALLFASNTGNSSVTIPLDQVSPIPPITLSKNYDFTLAPTGTPNSAFSTTNTTSFPLFSDNSSVKEMKVMVPADAQSFIDQQPQFKGTARPNSTVTITIHSQQVITATVKTDKFGNWSYRPSAPLSPGQHILSVTAKATSGLIETIKRSFAVYAQGSQFIEPSVAPEVITPTPTPGQSPATPTPTKAPTPTASKAPTPTPNKQAGGTVVSPTQAPSPTPAQFAAISPVASPHFPFTANFSLVLGAILCSVVVGIAIFLTILARSAAPL